MIPYGSGQELNLTLEFRFDVAEGSRSELGLEFVETHKSHGAGNLKIP